MTPARPTPGPVTSARVRLAWPDLLDALEERNRRCADLLSSGPRARDVPGPGLPDLDLEPDGPLPPELALRAQLLLAEAGRLEQRAGERLSGARLALHYSGAPGR